MRFYLTRKNQRELLGPNNKWMVLEKWLITMLSRNWANVVLIILLSNMQEGENRIYLRLDRAFANLE